MSRQLGNIGFPSPGPVVRAVMILVFAVWLVFAVTVNWLELRPMLELFRAVIGDASMVAEGQLWRFASAPLLHGFEGSAMHMLSTVLGVYFLGTSLEEAWGPQRFVRFLVAAATVPYVLQFIVVVVLPASVSGKLLPGGIFFGGLPVVEAIAVAWALSFKNRQVLLFFVLPVSARALLFIVIGFSVLSVLALGATASGLVAPFFGMGVGWLLGAGTPSPLRRWWLKRRLAQLDKQAAGERTRRKSAVARSGLRVIDGGRGDDRGPDGGYLN